ncbi:helix-turn-helix domain-containing protein [Chitinophaga qingshengii]|uniref:AraC family transcriptional regulator n=1 Tax=Chitinophaga qingshengii TaxID=1569794 RepID=A0ABR7TRM7_9BACT|nr:helix-turn-helix domain-containing protein [Chitinophaga qingshengii]MBC9932233.1 AraC family transcriptional regulator [Chitinophaga qingshengii]
MPKPQSLLEFYQEKMSCVPDHLKQDIGEFNVFRMEDCQPGSPSMSYNRRDFYKISLLRGKFLYHFPDRSVEAEDGTMLFFNPQVPYAWEMLSEEPPSGYFCIFKESFLTEMGRNNPKEFPMFTPRGKVSYQLDAALQQQMEQLYLKMLDEIQSDYRGKYDLIRAYLMEMLHLVMKTEPSEKLYQQRNASERITAVFMELLERQFPIEAPGQLFRLRTASDFATELSVHVNHLNRAIKETTGKTTTHHIAERVVAEAKALLRHSSWNVAEISYSLGFEEPSHFNNFFRKHTQTTPTSFRSV